MRIDAANTAWVLVSAALVMFMTPGLALFYGGMVRAKNVLAMLALNFFSLGLVRVLWVVFGSRSAFTAAGGWWGTSDWRGSAASDACFRLHGPPLRSDPPSVFMSNGCSRSSRLRQSRARWPTDRFSVVGVVPRRVVSSCLTVATGCSRPRGAVPAGGARLRGGGPSCTSTPASRSRRRAGARAQGGDGRSGRCRPPLVALSSRTGISGSGGSGSTRAGRGVGPLAGSGVPQHPARRRRRALGGMAVERIGRPRPSTLGAASGAVAGLWRSPVRGGSSGGWRPIVTGVVAGWRAYFAVSLKLFGFDAPRRLIGVHLGAGMRLAAPRPSSPTCPSTSPGGRRVPGRRVGACSASRSSRGGDGRVVLRRHLPAVPHPRRLPSRWDAGVRGRRGDRARPDPALRGRLRGRPHLMGAR